MQFIKKIILTHLQMQMTFSVNNYNSKLKDLINQIIKQSKIAIKTEKITFNGTTSFIIYLFQNKNE